MPLGNLFSSSTQSPKAFLSQTLFLNQPSSNTNNSMPKSAAFFAKERHFSSSTSKQKASQLLISIGLIFSLYTPRQRRFLYIL